MIITMNYEKLSFCCGIGEFLHIYIMLNYVFYLKILGNSLFNQFPIGKIFILTNAENVSFVVNAEDSLNRIKNTIVSI